jgi:hypothetical protein
MTRTSASFFTVLMVLTATLTFGQPAHERLIAFAPDGAVLATIEGDASSAAIGRALDLALRRPDAHVRLTHNHPKSAGLSADDVEQLIKAGVDSIEAVGADGSRYEARRGPQFDGDSLCAWQWRLAYAEVTERIRIAKGTSDVDLDRYVEHLVTVGLHKAGIITYRFEFGSDGTKAYARNRVVLGPITEAVAARLKEGMASRANRR